MNLCPNRTVGFKLRDKETFARSRARHANTSSLHKLRGLQSALSAVCVNMTASKDAIDVE